VAAVGSKPLPGGKLAEFGSSAPVDSRQPLQRDPKRSCRSPAMKAAGKTLDGPSAIVIEDTDAGHLASRCAWAVALNT
jgi:hypothetical protein